MNKFNVGDLVQALIHPDLGVLRIDIVGDDKGLTYYRATPLKFQNSQYMFFDHELELSSQSYGESDMYMLVRYTDEAETSIAAVIAVAGHTEPLRWQLNKSRPDRVWDDAQRRAHTVMSDDGDDEAYFGIEHVNRIDGYTLKGK